MGRSSCHWAGKHPNLPAETKGEWRGKLLVRANSPPHPTRYCILGARNSLWMRRMQVDLYGLGFDPYKDAEDFRALKRKGGGGDSGSGLPSTKRRRGVAFGTGCAPW